MIQHDIPTKDLIVNAVCGTNIDNGSTILLFDTSFTPMSYISLESDAFSDSINGQAQANGFPKSGIVTFAGTIAYFQIINSQSFPKISGTVTTAGGGGDIELSSLTYAVNEQVLINSLIYRVPN